jgi:hypothetical protein
VVYVNYRTGKSSRNKPETALEALKKAPAECPKSLADELAKSTDE